MNSGFSRKFGFNVFNRPLEDFFDYASDNGLHHIEINLTQEHSSLTSFNPKRIDTITGLASEHGIELSLHLPYSINISDIIFMISRSNIKYVNRCVDLANKISATHITAHIGNYYWFPIQSWMKRKALDRFIKHMRKILLECEKLDVKIALENVVPIPRGSEFYLLGDCVEDYQYIFSKINSECLKFCLDTGHANMAEGVAEYIQTFKEKLVSVHYHDNNQNNDAHLPVGSGTISWLEFAKALNEIQYNGPLISECHNIKAHEAAQVMQSYFDEV